MRTHPIYKDQRFHGGIDIAVKTGTPVLAAAGEKLLDVDGFLVLVIR